MENVEPTPQAASTTTERATRSARFFSNLHRLRSLLLRLWWIPLITTSLGLSVQWFILSNSPPVFISVGQMMVGIQMRTPEGQAFMEEWSNFTGTQAELMKSGRVLAMAQERLRATKPELKGEPPKIGVAVMPKTTIFVLRAVGAEPEYTREYLQACMDAYIEFKNELRDKTSENTLKGITEELRRLEKDLRKGREELSEYQSSNRVLFLTEEGNSAARYLSNLRKELADRTRDLEMLDTLTYEQSIQLRNTAGAGSETTSAPTTGFDPMQAESNYLRAKQEIQMLKVERDERSQVWRPLHPKMVKLNEDIASREGLLNIYREQSKDQLNNRKAALSLVISNLVKSTAEWEAKSFDANRKISEVEKLKSNIQTLQSRFDQLQKIEQTVDLNKEITPETVTSILRASPAVIDRGNAIKAMAIAGMAGLALGLGILFLLNQLDDRLNSYTELKGEFDEEVLGQIPRDRQARRGGEAQLIRREDDRHAFMEAYRNLRSSLLYLSSGVARPKTILVTSSIPNDGKSMTTANLAITMALSGSRVLLVDADLRKGVQHQRFGLQSSPGLSEALGENKPWQSHVQATNIPSLSLLSRGGTTQRSSELFLNAATSVFLRESVAQYDLVIIDSPPVMAADDVTSLAPNVDGVIFVIRAQQTSARVAHAALELLYQRRVNVLGLVFNAVEANVSEYYYYKYRDYYSSYPAK